MELNMIELHPKGNKAKSIAADIADFLTEEKIEYEAFDYSSLGIGETLLISVIGSTLGHVIEKLLDRYIFKSDNQDIQININFEAEDKAFKLPEEKDQLDEFMKLNQ